MHTARGLRSCAAVPNGTRWPSSCIAVPRAPPRCHAPALVRSRRLAAQAPPARRPVAVAVASPVRDLDSAPSSSQDEEAKEQEQQQQHTQQPQDTAAPLLQPLAAEAEEQQRGAAASPSGALADGEDEDEGDCPVFIDRDGNLVEVLCCDYGFRCGGGRMYQQGYGQIPSSAWDLAWDNFKQEWLALRRSFRYNDYRRISSANPPRGPLGRLGYGVGNALVSLFARVDEWLEGKRLFTTLLPPPFPDEVMDRNTGSINRQCKQIRRKLRQLKLSNSAVWRREHELEAAGGGVDTPWFVRGVYLALCLFLDAAYHNRPIQRFWFLETVARMPYFSYITMLHLYESLGWWRAGAELRKVHSAAEWNEMHHLQIMESLGGDQLWVDRFMAQHAAVLYYFVLLALFAASPALAYNFSELIETHAVCTYGEFADANEEMLKRLPPPYVAVQYYRSSDLYNFDEFQTARVGSPRTPECANLYDVFINIRDDEGEHVKTMAACQDFSIMEDLAARRDGPRRL